MNKQTKATKKPAKLKLQFAVESAGRSASSVASIKFQKKTCSRLEVRYAASLNPSVSLLAFTRAWNGRVSKVRHRTPNKFFNWPIACKILCWWLSFFGIVNLSEWSPTFGALSLKERALSLSINHAKLDEIQFGKLPNRLCYNVTIGVSHSLNRRVRLVDLIVPNHCVNLLSNSKLDCLMSGVCQKLNS